MAPLYDDSPEVAPSNPLPEVYNPPVHNQESWIAPQSAVASTYNSQSPKPEHSQFYSDPASAAPGYNGSNYNMPPGSTAPEPETKRRGIVCGCSLVVFVLSLVIAFLAVAVIGLAAGTGIAASNYNDANTKLDALSASYSSLESAASATTTPSATNTADAAAATQSKITNGCSEPDEKTTGETYTSKFFDNPEYTMYCERNAPGDTLLAVFNSDFNGCMESCTSWNNYNATEKACEGVSFIPYWADIGNGAKDQAPGSCYLKPGPQSSGSLTDGVDCHAAILST